MNFRVPRNKFRNDKYSWCYDFIQNKNTTLELKSYAHNLQHILYFLDAQERAICYFFQMLKIEASDKKLWVISSVAFSDNLRATTITTIVAWSNRR